jgi:hypothetical protein
MTEDISFHTLVVSHVKCTEPTICWLDVGTYKNMMTVHSFQYWNVVAYTTAEEYDLEKLTKGLLKQNLYVPIPPPRAIADPNQVGKGNISLKTIFYTSVELTSTSHSVEQNGVSRWPQYGQYQYEWGARTRRLMHRDHFPICCASPVALFCQ